MSVTQSEDLIATLMKLRSESTEAAVYDEYGSEGLEVLVTVAKVARELFKHVPHEFLTTGIDLIVPLDMSNLPTTSGGTTIHDLAELAGQARSELTVLMTSATTFKVWSTKGAVAAGGVSVLAYELVHLQREVIHVKGTAWEVNDSSWPCKYAIPTFMTLDAALVGYVQSNRVPTLCGHLEKTWRDDKRLAFRKKPEADMRRSLIWALTNALGQVAHVRPEQNQSETKPVDIEITWWGVRRSAIIEIKWLGDSGPQGNSFSTSYTKSRAVDGLKQLAEYLDLRDATSSEIPVMGYIFVFDARRKGLTATQIEISREDGLHYQDEEPDYPADILERPDIGRPYRCFMEPICVN